MTQEKRTTSHDREQILAEHREIAALTATITDFPNRELLAEGLSRLEPVLRQHFQREEGQAGLHESVEQRAPRHTNAIEQLAKEHREILAKLAQLRAKLAVATVDRMRSDCAKLFEAMREHEARETELFIDSVWSDLGTAD